MSLTTDLDADLRDSAAAFLLAVADDDFVWGHRLSEWVALGPTMEEDNTLAAMSQDEFGHARLFYEYVADHVGSDLDHLALNRRAEERRNTTLVEADHADFADTVAINYCYDEAERLLLSAVADGNVEELSARAAQARSEEPFHREHADRWLDRLVATDEGRERLTRALSDALPRAADYFAFEDAATAELVDTGVLATAPADLRPEWIEAVSERLVEFPLEDALDAAAGEPALNGRAGEHTDELDAMLDGLHPEGHVGDHPIQDYQRADAR